MQRKSNLVITFMVAFVAAGLFLPVILKKGETPHHEKKK